MIRSVEIHSAAAVCAAVAGAGFASGREIEVFFTRLGAGAWLGAMVASAGLGVVTAALMALARREQARSLPDLCGRLTGRRSGRAMHLLYGLLTLLTAATMIAAGGELGALALDTKSARAIGALAALIAGLGLAVSGIKAQGRAGMLLALAISAIYVALALTPGGADGLPTDPNLAAALPMGLLYASLNGALGGGVIIAASQENARPASVGVLTGFFLLSMLLPANAALLQCGARARRMALPTVALAAQWGVHGYHIVIGVMLLAVVTTLGAMLVSLRDQAASLGLRPSAATAAAVLPAAALSLCGFERLVNFLYPLLGWLCAFALLSLLLRAAEVSLPRAVSIRMKNACPSGATPGASNEGAPHTSRTQPY